MTDGPLLNPHEEIKKIVSKWAKDNIETTSPAVITNVAKYSKERVVTVQPMIIEKEDDGDQIVPQPIYNCPVILQGCADGHISFPLKVGELVTIGYCKRSIEEVTYSSNKSQVVPDDTLVFSSSNAVVLGYWAQPANDNPVSTDNFEIKFKDTEISITPNNKVTIDNSELSVTIDGDSCLITNGTGTWELTSSGDIEQNGAVVDITGNVITAAMSDLDKLQLNFDALVVHYNAHGTGAPQHAPLVPPFVPTP